jgi:exonuclease III
MKSMELKDFTTGTWNVRTLYKPGNLTTAILELERYRLDIIAIQEVRWTGEGSLKTGNWTVFHSGGDEHQDGVGFIVNDKILHRVKKFKAVNVMLFVWLNKSFTAKLNNKIKYKHKA